MEFDKLPEGSTPQKDHGEEHEVIRTDMTEILGCVRDIHRAIYGNGAVKGMAEQIREIEEDGVKQRKRFYTYMGEHIEDFAFLRGMKKIAWRVIFITVPTGIIYGVYMLIIYSKGGIPIQ